MEAPTFLPFGNESTNKGLHFCKFTNTSKSCMMFFYDAFYLTGKKVSVILPMVSILKNLENLGPTALPAFSAMRGYGSRTLRSRNSS